MVCWIILLDRARELAEIWIPFTRPAHIHGVDRFISLRILQRVPFNVLPSCSLPEIDWRMRRRNKLVVHHVLNIG